MSLYSQNNFQEEYVDKSFEKNEASSLLKHSKDYLNNNL